MTRRTRLVAALTLLALASVGIAIWWMVDGNRAVRGLRARMEHPRIILVTFDTLNVWYTSLFSEDGAPTPNLEALAEEGVLFEQAHTSVPITLPSHTALLSGRAPWSVGVLANGDRVPGEVLTLPEILSDHGYRTAAFVSLAVLTQRFNLDQGFDEYNDVRDVELRRGYRTAGETLEASARWLREHRKEPFFVWVHFSDPHGPYLRVGAPADTEALLDGESLGRWTLGKEERYRLTFTLPPGRHRLVWKRLVGDEDGSAPTPVLEIMGAFDLGRYASTPLGRGPIERRLDPRWSLDLINPLDEPKHLEVSFTGRSVDLSPEWVRAQYRAEVSYADRHLGELRRLIADLGLEQDTLWVMASDHGEGLYHHGVVKHAPHAQEDQLRTLWLLAGGGLPSGEEIESPVLARDVLPTMLEVLGLPVHDSVQGRSQRRCWQPPGCDGAGREWVAYGIKNKQRSLRSFALYRWPVKALWSETTRSAVFDLQEQPREETSLFDLTDTLRPEGEGTLEDPRALAMVRGLDEHLTAFRTVLATAPQQELDAEDRRILRSLGYL